MPERDNLAGRKAIKKNSTEISAEKDNNTIRPEPSRLTRIQLKKILLIKHKIKQKKHLRTALGYIGTLKLTLLRTPNSNIFKSSTNFLKNNKMASEDFMYELRIPKDRIAVLIGKEGEVKKELEKLTKTKIEVDSKEGEVKITGTDALKLYTAREIIRAIGRGFNPEIAKLLMKMDYGFELLPLQNHARNQKDLIRIKGRIIGEGGKSRKTMEDLTQTNICVYGKTAGIIGPMEYIADARKAIEQLLSGMTHAQVYRWLEKRRKERKAMF